MKSIEAINKQIKKTTLKDHGGNFCHMKGQVEMKPLMPTAQQTLFIPPKIVLLHVYQGVLLLVYTDLTVRCLHSKQMQNN
mgnify:CR=1 FL=1